MAARRRPLRFEHKLARGQRGLWHVMQRIVGAEGWVSLSGPKISRREAAEQLARLTGGKRR